MEPLYPHINVKLVGEDGNAFFIIGKVRQALRRGGVDEEKSKSSSRKRLRAITTTSSAPRCGGSKSTSRQIPKRRSEPIHGWFLPAPPRVMFRVRRTARITPAHGGIGRFPFCTDANSALHSGHTPADVVAERRTTTTCTGRC